MISLQNLEKNHGERVLFEDVTLGLYAGNRYGVVGANGSGKSTLLRILAGSEAASGGGFTLARGATLGSLEQDQHSRDHERIIDVAMAGDAITWQALEETKQLSTQEHPDPHRLAELEEIIAHRGGYELEARASAVLVGLGIESDRLREPLSVLSGGFKLRVLLARLLVGKPDVLLLDEPTNHLDILSIRWLEQFLASYSGCAVVVSHDHRFLNEVASHVLDVDYGTVTAYTGNYDAFVKQKEATRVRKEAEIERAQKQIAEKKAFIERFRAKATKARQAQSRIKQVEKIEVEELPQTTRRAPLFRFQTSRPSGREVLSVEGVSKAYGEKVVLSGVDLSIRRQERVAIIGKNGLGKTTLLKIMAEALAADAGTVEWGHETHVGYFAQDHRELLGHARSSVLDCLWETCPGEGTSFVRGQLGRMLFSGDDVDKPVPALSGGEAARLVFARLIVQKPNVLLLDEPTNHLDLESIEALVEALEAFEGTVVFVSHDRWFVSRLATRVIELTERGLRDFDGSYDEFLLAQGADHLDHQAVAARARAEAGEAKERARQGGDDGLSWQERKRLKNRLKSLPRKRDEVLEEIEKGEQRQKEIQDMYCRPGFFESTSESEVETYRREEATLAKRTEELTAQWEELEAELERLEQLDL